MHVSIAYILLARVTKPSVQEIGHRRSMRNVRFFEMSLFLTSKFVTVAIFKNHCRHSFFEPQERDFAIAHAISNI